MNSKKNIVILLLSSCLLFSSSGLSYGKTISDDPLAVNGFSSILDENNLNEAKRLYDEILAKYNFICVQFKQAIDTMQKYGISSIDDAKCIYGVIKLWPGKVQVNCDLLRIVLSTLSELRNEHMLEFMLQNHNSQEGQQRLGNLLVDLRRFVEIENEANVKDKVDWEKYFVNQYRIKVTRWNCRNMLNTLEMGNTLMINNGQDSTYQILKVCKELKCFSNAPLGLEKLLSVLSRYPQQENNVYQWLQPILRDVVNYNAKFSYLEPIVDGKKNLKDYDKEQRGVLKKIWDFATFKDTSDKGKAERALGNYINELKEVAKKIRNWK